jgi:hypothetical protein
MTADTEAARVAATIRPAGKKLLLAASGKRAKTWRAIYRHAKLKWGARTGNLDRFFTHAGRPYPWPVTLNDLGLRVRQHLQDHPDAL